ncbi:hypothetical protein ACI2KR_30000 [Pseudomonas luteola]
MESEVQVLVGKIEEAQVKPWLLDDWVTDVCCDKAMTEVNEESSENRQDQLIGEAESKASEINSLGFAGQVKFLLSEGFTVRNIEIELNLDR